MDDSQRLSSGTVFSSKSTSNGNASENANPLNISKGSGEYHGQAKDKLIENGKNKVHIECRFCSSRILNAGMSKFVETECTLPPLDGRAGETSETAEEQLREFWSVEDIYTFENIGFSNTVGKTKYLTCADCDRGPVGWHNLETRKSFVALSRVHHL
ncbi:guanine nucleotide exchange factor MSS4 homolog isoform X2 [Ornithodoros turicata]